MSEPTNIEIPELMTCLCFTEYFPQFEISQILGQIKSLRRNKIPFFSVLREDPMLRYLIVVEGVM